MGKQNNKLLKNIEKYEQKKKTQQQESKVLGQKLVNREANKEKVLACETKGVKVYAIWYEQK